ncbi:DUF2145 domain-containing protein [Candidatus Symbiobacter mobilis]|uniref:DUF2145 domain-containing protein n=1 Tax=Candidatus Symbiobacter mobilis CR TaxID=946483 RepID=U5NAU3_9BURK|nr:DUF2145 domain-containing protein [Candidatus Symbiobacter mobilis]AGX87319.1 hypothetical protein Cenrod_1227 [Candidatus Symbiobacter mobilis CR]
MKKRMGRALWCGLALLWALRVAVAAGESGSGSARGEVPHFTQEQVRAFAKKVEKAMAERGARVAILARMGRPSSELPQGMHFTHVAFAVYSEITTVDGRKLPGYAIHNLYQLDDRPDRSALVQDFPFDFFSGVAVLEAGVLVPSPTLQDRLLRLIGTPAYAGLHEPHYSVIANPFTLGRQNCTEFVLDVLHSAIYQTADIDVLKANEKAYFEAQPVRVNPVKLLFGAAMSADVFLADHPGSPVTATFETLGKYLLRYDAGSSLFTVLSD